MEGWLCEVVSASGGSSAPVCEPSDEIRGKRERLSFISMTGNVCERVRGRSVSALDLHSPSANGSSAIAADRV